jgi:hypothetical protein
VTGYGPEHRAERARQTRDWFGTAVVVPRPGPGQVVIAITGEDGARAATVVSRATLAEDGIMPGLLAQLDATQAEVRARKEAG